MNSDDLWVDLKQASSCLLIGTRGFFMPFLVVASADPQTKPAVFGCFGKKRKNRKSAFYKIKPNKREPKDQFSAVTGGSNWSFLYRNPEKSTKQTREEIKMEREKHTTSVWRKSRKNGREAYIDYEKEGWIRAGTSCWLRKDEPDQSARLIDSPNGRNESRSDSATQVAHLQLWWVANRSDWKSLADRLKFIHRASP